MFTSCWTLTYFSFKGYFCVSTSAFASLVAISTEIASPALGLKICVNIARITKYKSIIKKKEKKHDSIVFLGKTKLNTIEVLIFKALADSYITHDKFVSVNNVLREYNKMKEQNKIFCRIYYIKMMETYRVSCQKNNANENSSVRKTK